MLFARWTPNQTVRLQNMRIDVFIGNSLLNAVQRSGYEQCAKNGMIFGFAASQNFCSLIFQFAKKFWRPRKYTIAFGFCPNLALLIAIVVGCVLFSLLANSVRFPFLSFDYIAEKHRCLLVLA